VPWLEVKPKPEKATAACWSISQDSEATRLLSPPVADTKPAVRQRARREDHHRRFCQSRAARGPKWFSVERCRVPTSC
jgi:hypothetical protein